ncbi:uncharacterized protein LAESUDRAFT_639352 [Laetiporus sulphureus 93-53]|uniref:Uncharacterized protein n=1 Tax=Laetiporus sulphureus 93-53 TaxID=1314785 RepID=A0A165IDW8_9APHY|nr:uncharacterized protein LAESUDRAFT_639352 [Laetiporus sulphureus 93-53]KZT12944.1 hypothetical protein LAESUDRAFT_639352 [Laetiporus sulphureus 93-53]
MDTPKVYRAVVREVYKASISSRVTRSKTIPANFRAVFEQQNKGGQTQHFHHDMQNAVTFLQSQRMYKTLLDRYNPLHDLTTEERVKATARRVGLDMPARAPDDQDN